MIAVAAAQLESRNDKRSGRMAGAFCHGSTDARMANGTTPFALCTFE
ncbi:MAG: hypothetical protein IT359_15580 [Gemmatimonadaceae bacterium]|nr:hypothetical protein [Gemmatimonadaceae bacterium]